MNGVCFSNSFVLSYGGRAVVTSGSWSDRKHWPDLCQIFMRIKFANRKGNPLRKRFLFLLEFAANWMPRQFLDWNGHGLD